MMLVLMLVALASIAQSHLLAVTLGHINKAHMHMHTHTPSAATLTVGVRLAREFSMATRIEDQKIGEWWDCTSTARKRERARF